MAANPPPSSAPANDDVTRGLPLYASTRAHLKDLLAKKARVEEQLRKKEEEILQKETEYLLQTPAGNIITGFDSYVKNVGSSGGMTASRRKVEITDSMRVFSGSSVSFVKMDDTTGDTASSTPMATAVPTPISTTFLKGETGSNAGTPTSATGGPKSAGGFTKKNKKAGGGDDSDTDTGVQKKARTNFGAVPRK